MSKAQELIEKIENANLEEVLFRVPEWEEELAQYEEGNAYFDKKRAEQSESLRKFKESIEVSLRAWPEA